MSDKQKIPVKQRIDDVKEAVGKSVRRSAAKEKKQAANTVTSNRLKMLVTVVNRNKAEYFVDLIQSYDVNMQLIVQAKGTANEKMLSLLGLTDSSKVVIFGIIQEVKIVRIMRTLEEKFNTIKGGKGVAFTVPLTGVIGKLIFGFLSDNRKTVQEGK